MHQSELEASLLSNSVSLEKGIWFDPDRIMLEGSYTDQVTAYRARRRWIKTFETNFLLEGQHDFKVQVTQDAENETFRLRCDFLTACGRYAFWRLTHNQAPEVQHLLETAHLPATPVMPKFSGIERDFFNDLEPCVLTGEDRRVGEVSPVGEVVRRCLEWVRAKLNARN
jgi:hypothetical protein